MTTSTLPANEIIQRDPLLRWLCIRLKWSDTRIIIMASLLVPFILLFIGSIANAMAHSAQPTDGITGDLPLIAMWTLIFSPIIWGFYLWQAQILSQIFRQLEEKGVLGRTNSQVQEANADKIEVVFRRATHPVISLLALIFVAGYWGWRIASTSDQSPVQNTYWFQIKWYLPLYISAWSLALYALYVAIIRQIVFIAELSTLFRNAEIQINPLDADEVGGLAPVSHLISGTLVFLIGFGLLVSLYILVGYYYHGPNIFHRLDILAAFAIYVVLAPFGLFVPTLAVRDAMLRARSKILAPIAEEFRNIIEQGNLADQNFKEQNTRLKELQERYNTIVETYPVVPLSKSLLRLFSLAASIPYLSGVIPIAVDWLNANRIIPH